jgi:hypothetical protein
MKRSLPSGPSCLFAVGVVRRTGKFRKAAYLGTVYVQCSFVLMGQRDRSKHGAARLALGSCHDDQMIMEASLVLQGFYGLRYADPSSLTPVVRP